MAQSWSVGSQHRTILRVSEWPRVTPCEPVGLHQQVHWTNVDAAKMQALCGCIGEKYPNPADVDSLRCLFARLNRPKAYADNVSSIRWYWEHAQSFKLYTYMRHVQQGLGQNQLPFFSSAMINQGIRIAIRGFEKLVFLSHGAHDFITTGAGTELSAEQLQALGRIRFSVWPWNTASMFPAHRHPCHWGLVIYDRENATAYHFDSMSSDSQERAAAAKTSFQRFLQDANLLSDMFGFVEINSPCQSRSFISGVHVFESARAFFHEHRLENWHQSLLYKMVWKKEPSPSDADFELLMIRNWTLWSGASFGKYSMDLLSSTTGFEAVGLKHIGDVCRPNLTLEREAGRAQQTQVPQFLTRPDL
ncbi:hypothetical protein F4778DRAFT_735822 [Xylariomycetidae sp. FL2044]|nr:hypothetical protein F4778DRAFT_735822 [Xylariomycetidae sp. FL2044]